MYKFSKIYFLALLVAGLALACNDGENAVADPDTVSVTIDGENIVFDDVVAEGLFTTGVISNFVVNGSNASGDSICLEIYNGGAMLEDQIFPVTEPSEGPQTTVAVISNGSMLNGVEGSLTLESTEDDVMVGNFDVIFDANGSRGDGLFNVPFTRNTATDETTECR